ncbi:hypothetical protein KUTeg_014180, partial [Tegillarca granosa]
MEKYIAMQAQENTYDLEANLAVLKLYQFNPGHYQTSVTLQILLKALTNMPHTDFTLCKCLIDAVKHDEEPIIRVMQLADMLETFVCHVVSATYQTIPLETLTELLGGIPDSQVKQWISKYGWNLQNDGTIYVTNQEENIKTKNITEKITF